MQTDPDGMRILTPELADGLKSAMSIQDAIEFVGSSPYRDEHPPRLTWYTMGGAYLHVGLRLSTKCITGASVHSELDRNFDPTQYSVRLSTEHIVRYFILHSNAAQRSWLISSMEALPKLHLQELESERSPDVGIQYRRIRPVFEIEKPILHGEHQFNAELNPLVADKEFQDWMLEGFGQTSVSRYFDGKVPEPFGVRNSLCEAEANRIWQRIVNSGTSKRNIAFKEAQEAIASCDPICSRQERQTLVALMESGNYADAEARAREIKSKRRKLHIDGLLAKIRAFESSAKLVGRSYMDEENADIWFCYQHIVFERDDNRCQHCGRNSYELDGACLNLDHVVPLSRGGETCLSNLQLLCGTCNSKKGMKLEEQFPLEVQSGWFKNRQTVNMPPERKR